MNTWAATRRLLRILAIAIALAAAIDPAVTSNRISKPEIAVVASDPRRDSALADRVAGALNDGFTVIRAPFAAAAGTVIAGDRLPEAAGALAAPVFAVSADRDAPLVTLESVDHPASAPLDARVSMHATARVTGARGRSLEVTLRAGDLVVDRTLRTVATDDERFAIPLAFVPTAAGAQPLHVVATLAGAREPAAADLVVDVRDTRWSVLFFDPRPSWMSTFVRRVIERDQRFVVTSRVVTSRNVSTDYGQPPPRLDDLGGLARFDAVVVGAPEGLSESDVSGLDTFLRRRGGGVVLLFDQRVAGPYERLTDVRTWLGGADSRVVSITATGDSSGLRASEVAWPSVLPAGAEFVARSVSSGGDSAGGRPVVWRSAVGAGTLVVSGALDSWRFRDPSVSGFEHFWQTQIAEVASGAPSALRVSVSIPMLEPNQWTSVTVTLRDAALRSPGADERSGRVLRASASAALVPPAESGRPRINVRLWPDAEIGTFVGTFRAPSVPGLYRLVASGDGSTAEAPIVVASGLTRAEPDERDLLRAWATSHDGSVLAGSQLKQLPATLRAALRPTSRAETWHPMRSAWWIIPFALALCGEWWLRRRRGLA